MNIYFDFEIAPEYKGHIQSEQSKALTDEIKKVIKERLGIILDEIDLEENNLINSTTNDFAMIMINIMQEKPSISYIGYSTSLTNKNYRISGRRWDLYQR